MVFAAHRGSLTGVGELETEKADTELALTTLSPDSPDGLSFPMKLFYDMTDRWCTRHGWVSS